MTSLTNTRNTRLASRLRLSLAVALLAMMTSGCATFSGTLPQGVNLPTDCDQQPVPYPRIVKSEDLGVRSAKYAAALGQANTRIVAGNKCNARVRAIYAQKPGG